MTEERLVLAELLEKAGEGDFLRGLAEAVLQLLMETDVEGLIGAGRYERSGERTTWRNGHRDRILDTRLGVLQHRFDDTNKPAKQSRGLRLLPPLPTV
jgi:putative transposase